VACRVRGGDECRPSGANPEAANSNIHGGGVHSRYRTSSHGIAASWLVFKVKGLIVRFAWSTLLDFHFKALTKEPVSSHLSAPLSSRFVLDRSNMTWIIESHKHDQETMVLACTSVDALGLKGKHVMVTQGSPGYFEGHMDPAPAIGSMIVARSCTSFSLPGGVCGCSLRQGFVSWELEPRNRPSDWVSFANFLCDASLKSLGYYFGAGNSGGGRASLDRHTSAEYTYVMGSEVSDLQEKFIKMFVVRSFQTRRGRPLGQVERPSTRPTLAEIAGSSCGRPALPVAKQQNAITRRPTGGPRASPRLKEDIICSSCGIYFTRSSSLNRHVRTVHHQATVRCPHCDRSFGNRANRQRHIEIIHLKSTRFCCEYCGSRLSSKFNLVRHVNRRHASQAKELQVLVPERPILPGDTKGHEFGNS